MIKRPRAAKLEPPYDNKYVGGIVDGEGCIDIYRARKSSGYIRYCLRLSVQMTCNETIEGLKETFKVGSITKRPPRKKGYKPTSVWEVTGAPAADILSKIMGFTRTKHAEVAAGLDAHEEFEEQREKWTRYPVEVLRRREWHYWHLRRLKRLKKKAS